MPSDEYVARDSPFYMHKVGDRVCRPEDVYRKDSRLMYGVVTEHYIGRYGEHCWAVRWDRIGVRSLDEPVDKKGYFSWGIRQDPTLSVRPEGRTDV